MAFGLEIEYVPLDSIKPYKNNAKKHPPEQIKQIANSISEFGMADPIAVCNNIIVEGHGRYLACKELNYNEVPIIRLDWLTEEQRKAYTLIHNKLTLNSDFDLEVLNRELDGILDLDMSSFGFDVAEEQKPTEPTDDNYDAPIPVTPKSKPGDIYELGQHRVMCGDSTDPESVATLMDGKLADLLLTDPPYNVAIGNKNKVLNEYNHGKRGHHIETNIAGDADGKTDEQVANDLWQPAFKNAIDNAADDCAMYATTAQGSTHSAMQTAIQRAGWQVKHTLIWVKNCAIFSMGRLDYDYKHEPILYGWNKRHNFYAVDYKTSVMEQIPEDIDALTEKQAKKLLKRLIDNDTTTVINCDKPQKSELHPTMKPVPLFGQLIQNSTKEGNIVLDLFGGSGTTVIACEQLKRKAYVMEYDPRYVDVIVDRWEKYTGEKAVKIEY